MKRRLLGLALALVFVTGCGNHVVCTKTEEMEGKKVSLTVETDIKDDTATNIKMIYDLGDKDKAKQYCDLMKNLSSDGKGKVECTGTKIIMTNMEELSEIKTANTKTTKDEYIKEAEKEGFKCH